MENTHLPHEKTHEKSAAQHAREHTDFSAQPVTHAHGTHTHTHEHTKQVLARISRAAGHLSSIKNMVESGADCPEVLTQLAAVKGAINSVCEIILKDHMDHCIVDAVRTNDISALDDLERAIKLLISK
ncbi:MAG: metal-sensing transcriptional repressor [Oscillospiraceae bacterium]|jgi:DNA-binding FrmR family transcriptional regulator|nr:metal-sensing transcriptional repressor [Oscillospiraceae bacterium]